MIKVKNIFNWENFDNVSGKLKTEEMNLSDSAIIHFASGTTERNQKDVFIPTLDL